jgi:tellurite resistance protein TerC
MDPADKLDWTVFALLIAVLLSVDIAIASRARQVASARRAWAWSAVWIGVAIAFGTWIWTRLGREAALSYYTAYFLEKSLSIDNLAVFALIFAQTGITGPLQRRVLMWGVAGALLMRAMLIAAGLYILQKFQWVVYPFAALLLYAAVQMMKSNTHRHLWVETTCTLCSSWVARFIPITPEQHGERFTVRLDGKRHATPLLVALIAIESADLIFAIDSVPAVFAVTRDPFLVYTSNIFALLGLRSMYAIVGNLFERYPYLRFALTAMLVFVAIKLGASALVHIPPGVSLAIIVSILALAAAATRWLPEPRQPMPAVAPCAHRDQERQVEPADTGCTECKATGDTWVHLRMCQTCGHVGCCESSKNKHAEKHFHATGHPIIRSLERGEHWKWCYIDNAVIAYDPPERA